MKKKAVSLLLIAAMTAAMTAGCGSDSQTLGGSQDNSSSSDNSASSDSSADNTADNTASDDSSADSSDEEAWSGTITVWSPQEDQDSGWLQAQCDAFNAAHPNWDITFAYGVCPEGDAKSTVTTDVEGSADVYMLANDNIPDLVAANALAELGGSYLDYVTSTNTPSIAASVNYDGAVVAFPFTSNTWFMYYDKSVFSEEDIKSFDTMLEKGKVSFPLSNSWYIQAFYAGNGCSLFGDGTQVDKGIDFGGDKAVAVTDYLIDLAANPNFINDADGSGIAGMRDGNVSAIFSGTWDAENVRAILGDNMGVAALPSFTVDGKSCQMKSFMGSKAIGVNPHAENMQVSMALAAYLASEDAQKAHYDMRSILPSNINIVIDDEIASAVSEVMANTSIVQPLAAEMGNYWSPAENMGKNILAGDVTHDNAAEKTEAMNTAMNTDIAQ